MYDKDKQSILDMQEAIEKIFSFTKNISNHRDSKLQYVYLQIISRI
jgi:hypothetical protein